LILFLLPASLKEWTVFQSVIV